MQLLKENPGPLNLPDEKNHCTPLHCAVYNGQIGIVKILIKLGAYIDHQGPENSLSPILEAVAGKQLDVFKLLIQEGVELNTQSHDGYTPDQTAIKAEKTEAAELL